MLAVSKPFPQYPWTMRSDLKPELKVQIKEAFLTLDDKVVLGSFKATAFGPMSDSDYDVVRELAKLLNPGPSTRCKPWASNPAGAPHVQNSRL